MVDINNLNYLPELDGGDPVFPDEIPRLENGWWPTGGAVDPENDGGLMNWQGQLLARRTRWLHENSLLKSGNLSGLADAGTARTNLGATSLGSTLFTIAGASAARDALGLGTAATTNTGTSSSNVPTVADADGRYLRRAQNLADLSDSGAARDSLGLGTAAVTDSVDDLVDGTSGRTPTTRWMGLGETALSTGFSEPLFNYDANTVVRAQGRFAMRGNSVANLPPTVGNPVGILEQRLYPGGEGSERIYQIYWRMNDWEAGRLGIWVRYYFHAEGWSPWRRLDGERGSNANGEYVRFPDGTQICWLRTEFFEGDFQLSPGDAINWEDISGHSAHGPMFPADFSEEPTVQIGAGMDLPDAEDRTTIEAYLVFANTTQWRRVSFRHNGQSSANRPSGASSVKINLTAYGRWAS